MGFEQHSPLQDGVAMKHGPPSTAVMWAVAEAADADPTDLPPLHESVDPDALDALFRERAPGTVRFDYHGYAVTVRENAEVLVRRK